MLKKIYFVGDCKLLKASLVKFLNENHYDVVREILCSDYAELDISKSMPDLVILDIVPEEESSCLEVLKKNKANNKVPFIIHTKHFERLNFQKLLDFDIYGVVSDSTSNEQFLINIEIALKRFNENKKNRQDAYLLNEAQRLSNVGHWRLDIKSEKLEWSDETYRIFEKDKNSFSVTYQYFTEVIHPDDRDIVNEAYNNSLEERKPYEIEHRIVVNGKEKYVVEKCETFYHNGEAILSVGTVQDITAQKKSELELVRSRENFDEIFRSFTDEKCLVDPDHLVVLEANYLAAKELGYLKSEIEHKEFHEIVKSRESYVSLLESIEVLNLGEEFEGEGLQIKKRIAREFARKQVELERLNNILSQQVEEGTKKIQVEIEERKKAQELQQRFSNVIEQSSDLVMIADLKGVIEYANPALCDFTLYKKDEIVGKKPSMFKSDMYDDSYYKRLWSTIKDGRTFHDDFINKKKNGELYTVSQIVIPLKNLDGQITSFASVCRDSTEKKNLEKKTIDIQEAERARISREMHDGIGQSVAAIKLSINRVFEKYKLPQEDFSEIIDLINSLTTSVREISYNLMPSILTDYGLVTAAHKIIHHIEKNTNTEIHFNYPEEEKRFPKDIELSLFRILQESINNAVKYSKATLIEISLECDDSKIFLNVKDNGSGFDHENKKVLDGQGIRNMKRRAHLMNGVFELGSSENGTEIFVKVPFKNCVT